MSKKQPVSPTAAAIAGLAVGAAAGAAATVLSDKNTRKKLEKKMDQVHLQAQESYNKAAQKFDRLVKSAEPKMKEGIKKLRADNSDASRTKTTVQRRGETIRQEATDQIDELATKGGEVIQHNLPQK